MSDAILRSYAFNLDYAKRLVADLDDAKMCVQPSTGMNHAAWIIGHLAQTCDFVGGLLGAAGCPQSWQPLFGYGSHPSTDASLYPKKQELVQALADGHGRVEKAFRAAKPADLAKPHGVKELGGMFSTTDDLVTLLMTSHEGVHIGQLSAWRRAMGLPGVF